MFRKVAFALALLSVASAASANHECISGWHQVYPVVSCESGVDHTKHTVTKPTYTKPHYTKPTSSTKPVTPPPPPVKPPVTPPPPPVKPPVTPPPPPPVTKAPVIYPPPPVAQSPLTAPEMDPSSTIAGMTMLVGAIAVLRGRRRRSAFN